MGCETPSVQVHGFVVGVEIEAKVLLQEIVNKLSDSLTFVEGTGRVDVQYLGQVCMDETTPPDEVIANSNLTPGTADWPALPTETTDVED